jgi:nitrite reductase (NADH) large subunit
VVTGRERLLVVGNGMAGERFLDEFVLRGGGDRFEITVVGEEDRGAYNRIMLSRVVAGADPDEITTKPPAWYAANGIRLITGRWVQRLDLHAGEAFIGDRETVSFDHCVLATGSAAWVPPITGIRHTDGAPVSGVHMFRTMEDCVALRAETNPAAGRRNVSVVGGGLLGLELAKMFVDLGHHVTVLHTGHTLMDTQLDRIGGTFLQESVTAMGIRVVFGRTDAVLAKGHVEALTLEDGRHIPTDTVVFATGTRPRIETAVASGIAVNRGVLVDDRLTTSAPNVSAIGECAEHEDVTYGLVAPCWDQAGILADLLTGTDPAARYRGSKIYSRLKVAGADVASMGPIEAEQDSDQVVQVIEERRGVYRKLILRDGRLAGAVLVGDSDSAAMIVQRFDRGDPMPRNPVDVFCSVKAFTGADGAISKELCNCNRVSEETVLNAIDAGSDTVEMLRRDTHAGTGCGSCVGRLSELLDCSSAAMAAV